MKQRIHSRSLSIRARLLVFVLIVLAIAWAAMFVCILRATEHEVLKWDEARLVQTGQLLAKLNVDDLRVLGRSGIDVRNEIGTPGSDDADDGDYAPRAIEFQVVDRAGSLVALSDHFPDVNADPPPDNGFHRASADGRAWVLYATQDVASGRTVRLGVLANRQSDLLHLVGRHIAIPAVFAFPVLALLIWLTIAISLRPLREISRAVQSRDVRNLQPISRQNVPRELTGIVHATNGLLERLRKSMARERMFTADAAHELKTPLAAIKVQAQVALASENATQQYQALNRVIQGVDRSAHLAAQLLLLARVDAESELTLTTLELRPIIHEAMAGCAQRAQARAIVVTASGDTDARVHAEPVLLRALIDNLLDNAIKYGRQGGRVEIDVATSQRNVHLSVRDDGPGVRAEDRTRLTERFYRGEAATQTGSGLGLSIVERIAMHFDAAVRFDEGLHGRGLAIEIAFPKMTGSGLKQPSSGFWASRKTRTAVAS